MSEKYLVNWNNCGFWKEENFNYTWSLTNCRKYHYPDPIPFLKTGLRVSKGFEKNWLYRGPVSTWACGRDLIHMY